MTISDHHPFPFDPIGGMSLDELRASRPPEPLGFDAFWRQRYIAALDVDPRPRLAESRTGHPDWTVYDVHYTSTDGFEIGG